MAMWTPPTFPRFSSLHPPLSSGCCSPTCYLLLRLFAFHPVLNFKENVDVLTVLLNVRHPSPKRGPVQQRTVDADLLILLVALDAC